MGGHTLDECFKDASNKFFDFNGSDIDHIIPQMNSKKDKNDDNDETWKDEFSNLRLLSKVNNRSENMFTSEERFIGVDSSFPKEMHNKIFNRSCLNSRSEWIIKKIHFIVSEILNNINGIKKDVSEELSKYCMA
jgi:Fe-S cluster biosynthesis and repair protein YggX